MIATGLPCRPFALHAPASYIWRYMSHLLGILWRSRILCQSVWKSPTCGIMGNPLSFSIILVYSPIPGLQPIALEKRWTFQSWSIGASPPAPLTLRWRGNHSPGGGVLEWDHRLLCLKHLNKRRASSLILWIPLSFSFSIICRGPRLHSSVRGQQSFYA